MPITVKDIREAAATLQQYKSAKANLEQKIIDNEQWFKMRHWEQYRRRDGAKKVLPQTPFCSILLCARRRAAGPDGTDGSPSRQTDAVGAFQVPRGITPVSGGT